MKRKDLVKNVGYWTSKIQVDLYNELLNFMRLNKINQSQLAKKLGVSKGYISQILNGDFDHKISKFVELSLAIEKIPEITFLDLNKTIEDEEAGFRTIRWQVTLKSMTKFTGESKPYINSVQLNDKSELTQLVSY